MTLDEIRAKRHSFDGRGPRPDQIQRMKRLGMSGTLFNGNLDGQVFVLFVIVVAAAEAAVGLGIIIMIARNRQSLNVERVDLLKL